jgi:hypothetical protein
VGVLENYWNDSAQELRKSFEKKRRALGVPPLTGHVDYAAWSAWVGQYWLSHLVGGM